jgi:Cu/Ag efflux pump CusA
VIARVKEAVEKINSDGSLPQGVQLVPYYDRSTLVNVTTHTVIHNLIFGCLLVFFIQWVFLGDLRSAVIVSVNIPFALFFSIMMLVLTASRPTCCRWGGGLRHHRRLGGDPGREHLPQLPEAARAHQALRAMTAARTAW